MNNKRKFLSLAIDLEEFDMPLDYGCYISKEDQCKTSHQGLMRLISLLNKFELKVSFFTTANFAKTFPALLKSLSDDGHEIALHAVIEGECSKPESCLRSQKSVLEKIIEKRIYGCRTHKLVPISLQALNGAGFIYDNSLHPTYVPGRYCNVFSPKRIHINEKIIEVPVSVTPLSNLPFSWFWFRNLGYQYAIFCSKLIYLGRDYIDIYFHSWDFAEIGVPFSWNLKPLIRNTGCKMLFIFEKYIEWCRKNRVEIIPMLDYLRINMGGEHNSWLTKSKTQ